MPLEGTHEPGTWDHTNDQVEKIEKSNGTKGVSISGMSVVVLWTRGRKSGAIRKTPVMKVQDGDRYAAVGSKGGSATHPDWYFNVLADPHVTVQDGPEVKDYVAHIATPEERTAWWPIAVQAFPQYANYQAKTRREIPVVILEPQ